MSPNFKGASSHSTHYKQSIQQDRAKKLLIPTGAARFFLRSPFERGLRVEGPWRDVSQPQLDKIVAPVGTSHGMVI